MLHGNFLRSCRYCIIFIGLSIESLQNITYLSAPRNILPAILKSRGEAAVAEKTPKVLTYMGKPKNLEA